MRLHPTHLELRLAAEHETITERVPLGGSLRSGSLVVDLEVDAGGVRAWSVANRGDVPCAVRSVAVVHRVEGVAGALALLRHGYQSWSRTAIGTLGVDEDPSRTEGSVGVVRAAQHADQAVVPAGELRAEAVTVLADERGPHLLLGATGGRHHDTTVRVRRTDGHVEVVVEAFLGDAALPSGSARELHPVEVVPGDDAAELLEGWAGRFGAAQSARTAAPYQVGWCSWYHYFHEVSEADLRHNLAAAGDWPFGVFQLDDGFQPAIGDWLVTNDRFPSSLESIAADIAAAGLRPGIWLAPFLVAPDAAVTRAHPDWVARHRSGSPLVGNWNEAWGGPVWVLDTTNPEVLAHLEATAAALVEAGFDYLKLDFTYAPSIEGTYADPGWTPAERVRAGFDAIRTGAGDEAFLLGCGAPLACTVGAVDGMRIGSDVAPAWHPDGGFPGYEDTGPATLNAWRATLARSFMHRRLWLNDPDCVMLRTTETRMSPEAVTTWARAVGLSGGMVLVSDDLGLLGSDAARLLDEVLELGRAADAAAAEGRPPRCPDLLEHPTPSTLEAAGRRLEADPEVPTARLLPARRIGEEGLAK